MSELGVNGHSRPLVTLMISCYNQEWCIRDALEGAFSQTYTPLDIIISDDCSNDSTWRIVNKVTKQYYAAGGRHKVILNRNPENLYRADPIKKNLIQEYVNSLKKGDIIVQADGDDISLPNRVEEIVKCWLDNGKRPDLIMSGSFLIGKDGGLLGEKSCYSHLSGSSMAYTARLEEVGGQFSFWPIHKDEIRYYRAKMLGGVAHIDKPLLKYRICNGYSQVSGDFRQGMIRNYTCIRNNRKQLLLDVEKLRGRLSDLDYKKWKQQFTYELSMWNNELTLWESDSFAFRWNGYLRMGFRRRFLSGMLIYGPLLLLPRRIGDSILNFAHGFAKIVHIK